jgi:DNA polymerase I-like protein with 3'-5' exonuclease and polymerase domains
MLGSLTEGDGSWKKSVGPDGRIHGYVNHCGAVTSRCTHSRPNTGNIPSHGKVKAVAEFWAQCRELFTVQPGYKLVGVDAAKLELVALAHYLAHYDGGLYRDLVSSGDVHEANRRAAGLDTRDRAKTFIYALNYGAGDHKLGTIRKPTPEMIEEARAKHPAACASAVAGFVKRHEKQPSADYGPLCVIGAQLRAQFMANAKGFAPLVQACQERAPYFTRVVGGKRRREKGPGDIPLPDGRLVAVRSSHAALNTLLQGFGAVVMKVATNLACAAVRPYGARLVLHVHDEMQFEAPEEHAETVGRLAAQAITEAATVLKSRCPLGAEFKIGRTWRETH